MKRKKILFFSFILIIILFALLVVNNHLLEEIFKDKSSFGRTVIFDLFCAFTGKEKLIAVFIIGGIVLFISLLFDFVALIVSYLLLASVILLPLGLYNLTSISLTKAIIGTFSYNLIICTFIYFFSNWVKDIKIAKKISYLFFFAFGNGYLLLNITYVYIIKYIRLGNDLDIFSLISLINLDLKIIILFSIPYLLECIFTINRLRRKIKDKFYYINLYWLRYDKYFSLMEKIFKLSFVWLTFVCNDSNIYLNTGKVRKMIHHLYNYPFIIPLVLLIISLFEIILKKGHLKYGIYLFIIYLMLRPLIKSINAFAASEWDRNVCKADYIAGKWDNPRYYENFWMNFPSIREYFENQPEVEEDFLQACYIKSKKIEVDFWVKKYKLHKDIYNNIIKMSFKNRIKLVYWKAKQVQWDAPGKSE